MRSIKAVTLSLAAVCLFAFLSPMPEDGETGAALTPYVTWSGPHSKIEDKRYVRITSEEEWIDLWLEHVGMEKKGTYNKYYNPAGIPEIDFKRCMVVGVFRGFIVFAAVGLLALPAVAFGQDLLAASVFALGVFSGIVYGNVHFVGRLFMAAFRVSEAREEDEVDVDASDEFVHLD